MAHWGYRIYIDKKVTGKGGGEHSRVFDHEGDDREAAEKAAKLKKDEEIGQVVSLPWDPR